MRPIGMMAMMMTLRDLWLASSWLGAKARHSGRDAGIQARDGPSQARDDLIIMLECLGVLVVTRGLVPAEGLPSMAWIPASRPE